MTKAATVIGKVLAFPRLVREMNERLDPLDLEQMVIREMNWQLDRLQDETAEERCMQYLQSYRQQRSQESRAAAAYQIED
jgi:CRP-like cAMP-binding protein